MTKKELIASLHQSIEQLKALYPDRWSMMLNSIAHDPASPLVQMSQEKTPAAAQPARSTFKSDLSDEHLRSIARQVCEGR
ncbi:hypothetical protein H6F89_29650 [Cyanobacteria bacterium FACHB-63]|nr:hypothetical protein [Cyanobacteria bacterium FACHB-63]